MLRVPRSLWRTCSGLARTRVCTNSRLRIATSYPSSNFGRRAYSDLGDDAKKRDILEHVLPIVEREHGSDGVEVASVLNTLGEAHNQLGDYAKARDVLERALPIYEREQGNERQVANTLGNLGNAHGGLGDHAKKRDMLERVVAIKEWGYGRDHPEVANTLFNLAQAHAKLGDLPKRRELLERALPILKRAHGPDHPYTKGCQELIADTLLDLGGKSGNPTKQRTCWSARSLSLKVSTARTAKK